MAFQNATYANSNSAYYGNPADWSNFSTLNSTIRFNDTDATLTVRPAVPDSNTTIEFNGNQIAYVSDIPSVNDWSLFSSISNVGIPPPYALYADGANISTATISSLTVGEINGGGPNSLNISSINAQFMLTSSFALTNGNLSPNVNLGLGSLFGNIGAWAAGGMGLTVGSAALVTGTVGLLLPRQTNYITQGAVEMVNVTTQLQASTLAAATTTIQRVLDISNQEIFVSTVTTNPVQAIRSFSDPFQTVSTSNTSFVQAYGEWSALPNFAAVPALSDINVNTFSLLSTTSMTVYNPASLGGDLRVNTGPSYGGNWLAGLPGALQPQNPNTNGPSDVRLRQLMFNDGTGFTNEVMLVNTTNSGRIGVNCATPVVASALAYLSDGGGPGAFTLYVAKNGLDTNPGTINAPFLTIGAAITARALISNTVEVSIILSSGTYTENITITRNTYLVGIQTGEARQPCNIIGNIVLNDTTGTMGLSGLEITGAVSTTGGGATYTFFACNITNTSTAFFATAGTVFMTECRVSTSAGVVVISFSTLTLRDCNISTSGTSACINANSITTIRQCVILSSSASTSVQPLLQLSTNSATLLIEFCRFEYTSAVTDVAGNKCCIKFTNSSGTLTASISNSLLICEGAITGSPLIQCIQDTGAGAVNLSYGGLLAAGVAHHISPNVTKTAFTPVP